MGISFNFKIPSVAQRAQMEKDLRAAEAEEAMREALLGHIKEKTPKQFSTLGLSKDTPMDAIQQALQIQELLTGSPAQTMIDAALEGRSGSPVVAPEISTPPGDFSDFHSTRRNVGEPPMSLISPGSIPSTNLGVTSAKAGGVTLGQTPESKAAQDIAVAQEKAKIELDKTMKGTTGKELSEAYGKAGRMIQAIRTLSGLGKAMDDDFPGGGSPLAFVTGAAANIDLAPASLQRLGRPVLSYNAQLQETKIAAVPILSGQARYVVDLANAIAETVPNASRIGDIREDLLAQTVRNMMALTFGIQNGALTAERLTQLGINPGNPVTEGEAEALIRSGQTSVNREDAEALLSTIELTPKQEDAIEQAVDYVLDTKPIRRGKISGREKSTGNLTEDQQGLLERYRRVHPDRSDAELIRAMRKAGVLSGQR